MVHQQRKVYDAEWAAKIQSFDIMPNVRNINQRKIRTYIHDQLIFSVGSAGVIETVSNPNKPYSTESPETQINARPLFERSWQYVGKYYGNYWRRGNQVSFNQDELNYIPKDESNILERVWLEAEKLVNEYPNNVIEIDMGYFVSNGRSYIDKEAKRFYNADFDISLEVVNDEIISTWNKQIGMLRKNFKEEKNPNYMTTKELEKLVQQKVKQKIFSSYFYRAYFDTKITISIANSYNGSSHYSAGANHITLKKWAGDKTLLHELAHQGKGCKGHNAHDEHFTSQMLMLVGQFLGHKQQIILEEEYRKRGVHWLGNFFHTQECLAKAGVDKDSARYKNAKSNRTCANGSTRMTKKFSNWLTDENRKVKA